MSIKKIHLSLFRDSKVDSWYPIERLSILILLGFSITIENYCPFTIKKAHLVNPDTRINHSAF